jgi:hypothetical protein
MATYFHTTDAADAIILDGFRDGEGSYMLVGMTLRGVFIADVPVDVNEGAKGEDVLEVVLPDDVDLDDYEIVCEIGTYREWCVPAELINSRGRVRLLSFEETEEGHARWLQARRDRLA